MRALFPSFWSLALSIVLCSGCVTGCAVPGDKTANLAGPIHLSPADVVTPQTRQQIEQANQLLELLAGRYAALQRPMPVP
jgi:hypothetical protein